MSANREKNEGATPLRSALTPGFDPTKKLTPEEVKKLPTGDQIRYGLYHGMKAEDAEDKVWEKAKAEGKPPEFTPETSLIEVVDADDKHFKLP